MGKHDHVRKAVLMTIEDVKAGRMSLSAAYHLLGEPTVLPLGSTYGVSSDLGPLRLPDFDTGCRIVRVLSDNRSYGHSPLSYAEVTHFQSRGLGKWEGLALVRRHSEDQAGTPVSFRIDYLPGNGKPVHLVLLVGEPNRSGG